MRKQTKKNCNKSEKISVNVKITQVSGYLFENVTDPESCGRLGELSLRGGVIPTSRHRLICYAHREYAGRGGQHHEALK